MLSRQVDRIADLKSYSKQDVLATVGEDGMLILWHVPEGSIKDLFILKKPLSRLAWNPRGVSLAVGSAEGEICLFCVD